MRISSILVPIDFSECSKNALKFVVELNKSFRAKIVLLNGFSPPKTLDENEIDVDLSFQSDYKISTEHKIQRLEMEIPELQIMAYEYSIRMGSIPDLIAKTAFQFKSDLIIMGTRGTNTKLQDYLGSNAYAVIKYSKVPVLAIPKESSYNGIHTILFCADYKKIENTKPLEIIREFASISDAHLQILHFDDKIKDKQIEELLTLEKFFSGVSFSFSSSKEVRVDEGVETHIRHHKTDLIVLLHRKHFFPESILTRKITKAAVEHTKIPLLALPELKEHALVM